MEHKEEIIINDSQTPKPLKKFFLTANVHKSITYRNTETNDKMKGPYIFHDKVVPVEFIEIKKKSYNKKKIECPICFETFKIKDMIETKCHHYYCKQCFFSILHANKKKCALCREPQTEWITSSIKVEKIDFIDEKCYEITN
jgi:hypothetical protein